MKKLLFFALLLLSAGALCAAPVSVVSNGKSSYSIAWYDQGSPNLQREYRNVASLVQRVIQKRTGARLPVVKAGALNPAARAIVIGAAVKPGAWQLNEYSIAVDGEGNILLSGDDFDALPTARRGDHQLRMGSVKAAVEFLKKFAGADFLYPGFEGIYIPKDSSLTVPEKYTFRKVPYMKFCIGRNVELYYALANDKFNAPWYLCHGGHSHIPAIPPKQYLKTHLEYFAIVYGKRNGYAGIPQYCLSNPEVQELIYKRILADVDQPGVIETQLAQTDGFHRCECEKCKKFLGDDAGEAVWKLHLNMAERLLKDRPGKRVRIIAYHPTQNPPKYRKVFPKNTSVTIAVGRRLNAEYLAKWNGYTVPGGFDVYLYNWGEYQTEGLTPTFNLKQARNQADLLRKNKIDALYLCGFMELPGLCCPVNTYYLRAMNGDTASPETFLNDYCTKVFGKQAGKSMEQFYTLLYSRVDIAPSQESDYTLRRGAEKKSVFAPNVAILHKRYPEEILARLETDLKAAETAAPGNFMLKRTRREFDYLTLTAGVCNDFYAYHAAPTQANFEKLARRVIDRKGFIAALPKLSNNRFSDRSHLNVFGYETPEMLLKNGRLSGTMGAPFIWDMEFFLANKMRPSGRIIKADGKDFQQMVDIFCDATKKLAKEFPVFVGCRADAENFSVIYRFPKADAVPVKGTWSVKLQKDDKSPRYSVWRGTGSGYASFQLRVKSNADNNNMGDVMKNVPEMNKKYPVKAQYQPFAPGKGAELLITIPWGAFGGKPAPGEKRYVDFVWWGGNKESYIWEYNLNLLNWRHRTTGIGTVQF